MSNSACTRTILRNHGILGLLLVRSTIILVFVYVLMNEIGANNSRARMSANETGPGLLHSRPNYIGEEFVKLQVKFGYNNIAGMTKKLTLKQTKQVVDLFIVAVQVQDKMG